MAQTAAQSSETAAAQSADKSLYERLGGYDAICAATDDLLSRLMNDPQLKNYWKGASYDNRRKARQQIVDFMAEAAGGPAFYVGRDMKTSHRGLGITDQDWQTFLGHVHATLDHFAVQAREKSEVLGFVDRTSAA